MSSTAVLLGAGMKSQVWVLVAIVPMLYLRVKRSIGFRKFTNNRLLIPIALFIAVLSGIAAANVGHAPALRADVLGALCGFGLAALAMRFTVFEWRANDLYYRTHVAIQAFILGLFVARLGYRFYFLAHHTDLGSSTSYATLLQDPLTAFAFFLLFAYNLAYFAYVLFAGKRRMKAGAFAGDWPKT